MSNNNLNNTTHIKSNQGVHNMSKKYTTKNGISNFNTHKGLTIMQNNNLIANENAQEKEYQTTYKRNNYNLIYKNNKLFNLIGQTIIKEEEYLKDKTLIPNAHNYEKYLFVKKRLTRIAKEHNTKLHEEPNSLHAYFNLRLFVLDNKEMKILSKINRFCYAISIDANLNGQLEIGVTVAEVRCVLEK